MENRNTLKFLAIGFLAFVLAGCQAGTNPTETATGEKEGASARATATGKVELVTVPAGTALEVRVNDAIDTGKTAEGAMFEGTLAKALEVNGLEVAAIGSRISGKVTHVVSSGRLSRPAELSMALTSLTPQGGEKVAISTHPWGMKAGSHKTRDIEMIGGGAGVGALVGALAGGKKGAVIGGAVGAGAGTGAAAATGKKEIRLPSESKLTFKLSEPVKFSVKKKQA